jgi:hypothetical protein
MAALAVLGATGGLFASSCADNESSMFIQGHKVAAPGSNGSIECSADGTFLLQGAVDLWACPSPYTATLIVGNQVVPRGDGKVLRTETSRVELYEADVRVLDSSGAPLQYTDGSDIAYSIPISGLIDPSSNGAGFGCASVTLLDGGAIESLRTAAASSSASLLVVAKVIVRGRTLGGQEVESAEWTYPISVSLGGSCFDVSPTRCCSNPSSAECVNLDPAEVPLFTCAAAPPPIDCRLVGTTCDDLRARLRNP